ncbi:MAG: helix-turn-helix transcriptional regulator [Oscillospiraceae bacterium]|nr:helix-turn-helix transcriptional regulator [Oscillospiraceae bacterium]
MAISFPVTAAYCTTEPLRSNVHYHSEYELIFVAEGSVEVSVGKSSYLAGANDLILISNLEQHSLWQRSTVYRRYCAILRTDSIDALLGNATLLSLLKNHSEGFCHCINAAPIRETVVSVFRRLMDLSADTPFANDLAAGYLTELLANLCRIHPQLAAQNMEDPRHSRIFAVQQDLDAHFREPVSITDLCAKHFISLHYLSHAFKTMTGYSPKQYLTLLRLKYAADLLQNTPLSVQEAASESGFSDLSNFCRRFRQEYGCPPGTFREHSRSIVERKEL